MNGIFLQKKEKNRFQLIIIVEVQVKVRLLRRDNHTSHEQSMSL